MCVCAFWLFNKREGDLIPTLSLFSLVFTILMASWKKGRMGRRANVCLTRLFSPPYFFRCLYGWARALIPENKQWGEKTFQSGLHYSAFYNSTDNLALGWMLDRKAQQYTDGVDGEGGWWASGRPGNGERGWKRDHHDDDDKNEALLSAPLCVRALGVDNQSRRSRRVGLDWPVPSIFPHAYIQWEESRLWKLKFLTCHISFWTHHYFQYFSFVVPTWRTKKHSSTPGSSLLVIRCR